MISAFRFLRFNSMREDMLPGAVGGTIVNMTASGTLLVGDLVYVSAANTVAKSTTQANYTGRVGVVVGGASTYNNTIITSSTVTLGQTAALTGKNVIVQYGGIARVAAGGTITPGTNFTLVPDTGTAGRVIAGAGAVIGDPCTVLIPLEDLAAGVDIAARAAWRAPAAGTVASAILLPFTASAGIAANPNDCVITLRNITTSQNVATITIVANTVANTPLVITNATTAFAANDVLGIIITQGTAADLGAGLIQFTWNLTSNVPVVGTPVSAGAAAGFVNVLLRC